MCAERGMLPRPHAGCSASGECALRAACGAADTQPTPTAAADDFGRDACDATKRLPAVFIDTKAAYYYKAGRRDMRDTGRGLVLLTATCLKTTNQTRRVQRYEPCFWLVVRAALCT